MQDSLTKDELGDFAALLLVFKKLRDTLMEDRQQWAMTGGDMAQLVEVFEAQLNQFTMLHPHFKSELIQCIHQESKQAAQEVSQGVGHKVAQTMDQAIQGPVLHLEQVVQKARDQLHASEGQLRKAKWWGLGICVVVSLFGGLVGGGLVRGLFPAQSFTKHQHDQMISGDILNKAWDGLTKAERDKILALARGEKVPADPGTGTIPKSQKK